MLIAKDKAILNCMREWEAQLAENNAEIAKANEAILLYQKDLAALKDGE